jgi:hypothetical protein
MITKLKFNWNSRRWEWIDKNGSKYDDKEAFNTMKGLVHELVDEVNSLRQEVNRLYRLSSN